MIKRDLLVLTLAVAVQQAYSVPAVWTEHSALKVEEKTTAPLSVAKNKSVTMKLDAARNEWETAQLLVRSDEDLKNFTVRVGQLRNGSNKLPADKVEVQMAHYIYYQWYDATTDKMVDAWQPDPVPPLREAVTLHADRTQAFYVQVYVPATAKPGVYKAPVELSWDGGKQTHQLQVKVWSVTLPATPPCTTAFGYEPAMAAAQEGVAPNTTASEELDEKYYNMMLDYGVSAYHLPVPFDSPKAAKYAEDPRVTSFIVNGHLADDALTTNIELLKKNGWWKKAYFYTVDEPITTQSYAMLREHSIRLKKLAPDARIVSPFFCRAEPDRSKTFIDEVGDLVNINCCVTSHFNEDTTVVQQMMQAQKEGRAEAWWYVCCNPRTPYANLFISQQGMDHRILPWQMKHQNITGLLYWRVNHWSATDLRGTENPWTDMATVKDIDKGLYGDGSLFYPGKKVGVDGPVASVRLINLRDGLDDMALLNLLEQKKGRATVMNVVESLSKHMKDFTHDPAKLEKKRVEILRTLSADR